MSFRARQPRPPRCEPDTMRADQRCQGTMVSLAETESGGRSCSSDGVLLFDREDLDRLIEVWKEA
jgi:hypothetical protein